MVVIAAVILTPTGRRRCLERAVCGEDTSAGFPGIDVECPGFASFVMFTGAAHCLIDSSIKEGYSFEQ